MKQRWLNYILILTAILCVTAIVTWAVNPEKEAVIKANDVPYRATLPKRKRMFG